MTVEIASVLCGGPGLVLPDATYPGETIIKAYDNRDNHTSPCDAYQGIFESSNSEVICYIHDDVTIHDPDWLSQVMRPFDDPSVAVVGLGGATALGSKDLYKRPYRLQDMARRGYTSNQTDWQTHGECLLSMRAVSVVDAFFMAIRTDFLRRCGGWPVDRLSHHCLDLWLACECARRGQRTVIVPVSVTHHGGGSSTKPAYANAAWLQGNSLESDHQLPHVWLYENYRDVLPICVK